MHGNLFVASDTERSDCVAGFACRTREKEVRAWRGSGEPLKKVAGRVCAYCKQAFDQIVVLPKCISDRGCCLRWTIFRTENFGSTGKSITGFADRDVEDKLLNAEFAHRVCALVCLFRVRLLFAG